MTVCQMCRGTGSHGGFVCAVCQGSGKRNQGSGATFSFVSLFFVLRYHLTSNSKCDNTQADYFSSEDTIRSERADHTTPAEAYDDRVVYQVVKGGNGGLKMATWIQSL